MSDSVPEIKVEEVKVETTVTVPPVPEDLKALIEKTVKDVIKAAVKELLDELKKSPLSSLDKDGDGVISATEVKEAVTAQAQKLGCGPTCSIA
jgi:hypothetical protein